MDDEEREEEQQYDLPWEFKSKSAAVAAIMSSSNGAMTPSSIAHARHNSERNRGGMTHHVNGVNGRASQSVRQKSPHANRRGLHMEETVLWKVRDQMLIEHDYDITILFFEERG